MMDFPFTRRMTVGDIECTTEVIHGVFGRWPRQFNRHELGAPAATQDKKPATKAKKASEIIFRRIGDSICELEFPTTPNVCGGIKGSSIAVAIYKMRCRNIPDQEIWERVSGTTKLASLLTGVVGFGGAKIDLLRLSIKITITKPQKPRKERARCRVTNKRMYSHVGAAKSLSTALMIGAKARPKRMYLCDHCKKYHLTSKI